MVHITDSVSRLHVLKFIREHDMNKRLFMDFSGLSIIHNWMTSNENESFKLMVGFINNILQCLCIYLNYFFNFRSWKF